MAAGYDVGLRNAQLDAITLFVGNGALLRIYDGARPATGGAVTTKLAEFILGTPLAAGAAGAVLSPTIPAAVVGLANGTATWGRIVRSDGTTFCIDLGAGSEFSLTAPSVTLGLPVALQFFTITRGNP